MGVCTRWSTIETRLCRVIIKNSEEKFVLCCGETNIFNSRVTTILFEAANLINSRPICTHPNHPDIGCYLSPNEMLLGKTGGGGFLVIADERKKTWAQAELGGKCAK